MRFSRPLPKQKEIEVRDIIVGNVFKYNGAYYLLTIEQNDNGVIVVNLLNGVVERMEKCTMVTPVIGYTLTFSE